MIIIGWFFNHSSFSLCPYLWHLCSSPLKVTIQSWYSFFNSTLTLSSIPFFQSSTVHWSVHPDFDHFRYILFVQFNVFLLIFLCSKVDDYFLESKLKLNGERVLKKSKQVNLNSLYYVILLSYYIHSSFLYPSTFSPPIENGIYACKQLNVCALYRYVSIPVS